MKRVETCQDISECIKGMLKPSVLPTFV